ncbi:MAG: AAA family ATPase, partial [Lachnospiraceae bacterium]|nr:AAA family ATPase [Lachnospiraceae bacterium]
MRKKIGIGYEDYKEFIDNDMYYVDKTPLIRDILERGGKVTLFTRPRRFGKTLALSMLKTFFEKECGRDGTPADNSRYFEGMKVMDAGEQVLSKMGKFPVINLSLKSAKQPDFRTAFRTLRDEIIYEFRRHSYLWETEVLPVKKREELIELQRSAGDDWLDDEENVEKEASRYAMALKILSEALKDYHGENVIILLDEYDIPLENAYFEGFYRQMVNFICSLFGSGLKTNDALEMAVIMGCLRVSQDSLFTGLNHLEISSVYNNGYEEAFGFTQEETEAMLREYGMADWIPEAKEWYGGYLFGRTEIYNPWSVSNYVASVALKGMRTPQLFLVDTSSNK